MNSIIKGLLFLIFIGSGFALEVNGLCGVPLTDAPVRNSSVTHLSRDCPEGELFYVRSDVENPDPTFDEICFLLQLDTPEVKIYVETDRYAGGEITDAAISRIDETFNNSTPDADLLALQSGILSAEEQMYGLPPEIEGTRQVNILLMDVRDNFSGTGNYVGGYFDPNDQTDNPTSNRKNIIYIDCNPVDLVSANPEEALYTLAHEFQHLLHYFADPNEHEDNGNFNPWLDEGLSDLSPSILGLGHRNFGYYLSDTSIGLDQWVGNGLAYYAKSALFFQYFYETYGLDAVTAVFQDSQYHRIASLKNYLGDTEFDSFFTDWVQATISDTYPMEDCIFGISPQLDIVEALHAGQNDLFSEEAFEFNPYSFRSIAIPSIAEKSEIIDIFPAHDMDLLYDLYHRDFIEQDGDGEWYLESAVVPLIFSKIIYNNAPESWNIFFNLSLSNPLTEIQYDDDFVSMFLKFNEGVFHAVNQFPIAGQELVTGIAFKAGKDAPVTIKVKKRGISYTPSIVRRLCAPISPGWTFLDFSQEGLFIEDNSIFVEIVAEQNAIGYSSAYPDTHGNESNDLSFYSTNGENYNRISSLSVNGEPLNGNWVIRLVYADSSFTAGSGVAEDILIFPNPFFPATQPFATTRIVTTSNEHVSLDIYDLIGQHIIRLYEGTPAPDSPIPIHWRGTDASGKKVASGTYFFQQRIDNRIYTNKLVLIH